jgi:hypothetical protein
LPWGDGSDESIELNPDQADFISRLRNNSEIKALYENLLREQIKLADKYDVGEFGGDPDWNAFLDTFTGSVVNDELNKDVRLDNLIRSWAAFNWDADLWYALDPDGKIPDRELHKKIVEIMEGGYEAFQRRNAIYKSWQ